MKEQPERHQGKQQQQECGRKDLPRMPNRIRTHEEQHALQQDKADNSAAPPHASHAHAEIVRKQLVKDAENQDGDNAKSHRPSGTKNAQSPRDPDVVKKLGGKDTPQAREDRGRRAKPARNGNLAPEIRRHL